MGKNDDVFSPNLRYLSVMFTDRKLHQLNNENKFIQVTNNNVKADKSSLYIKWKVSFELTKGAKVMEEGWEGGFLLLSSSFLKFSVFGLIIILLSCCT